MGKTNQAEKPKKTSDQLLENPKATQKIMGFISLIDRVLIKLFFQTIGKKDRESFLDTVAEIVPNKCEAFEAFFENENTAYPIDAFGTADFSKILRCWNSKVVGDFYKKLNEEFFVFQKNVPEAIKNICDFRSAFVHRGNITGAKVLKAIEALFTFLPEAFAEELCVCSCNILTDKKDDIGKELAKVKKENNIQIRARNNQISKDKKDQYKKEQKKHKTIKEYKLFNFIKTLRMIDQYGIAHLKHMLKLELNSLSDQDMDTIRIEKDHKRDIKDQKVYFEEWLKLFFFFIELNGIFHTYFISFYELKYPKKGCEGEVGKIRNSIAHNNLFFEDFKTNQDLFSSKFQAIIQTMIDFLMCTSSKDASDQGYAHAKDLTTRFVHSLKSLMTRKDYLDLVVEQKNEKGVFVPQIHRLGISTNLKKPRKSYQQKIKQTVGFFQETENTKTTVFKYKLYAMLKYILKNKLDQIEY